MPAEIEIVDRAVLRVAGWPIEITDRFAAPGLAELASRVLRAERRIVARRADTLAELESAIPAVPERRARAWLLSVKRLVYNGLDTIPEPIDAGWIDSVPALAAERDARARRAALITELHSAHEAELARQGEALGAITADPRFARALVLANSSVARAWQRRSADPPRPAKQRRLETTVFRYLMRAVGRATPQGAWAGVAPVDPDGREGVAPRVVPARRRYAVHVDLTPFAAAATVLSGQPRYRQCYPLRANPTLHLHDGTWWYEGGSDWVAVPDSPLVAPLLDAYRDGAPHDAEPLLDAIASVSASPERLRSLLGDALDLLLERDVLRSALEFPPTATDPDAALRTFVDRLIEPDRSLWNGVVETVGGLCASLADGFDRLSPGEVGALIDRIRAEVALIMAGAGLDLAPDAPVVRVDMAVPFSATWSAGARARIRDHTRKLLGRLAIEGMAERFRAETVARLVRAAPAIAGAPGIPLVELFHLISRGNTGTSPVPPGPSAPGPGGTLVFTTGGDGYTADWGRPQPAIFAARFAELLPAPVAALRGLMRTWPAVEIVGTDPLNRNAAVRPDLTGRQLPAHTPEAARLTVRVENGRPWLYGPEGRLLPVYSSAALIGLTDPCSRVLYTLAMSHGWELVADEPARRWAIDESTVDELLTYNGSERYLAWRRLAERLTLPELVWAGRAGELDDRRLLIRTDSPLAVACLLRESVGGLVLTALPGDPVTWPVRDESGNHYLAEIAITWYDKDYLARVT